MKEEFNAVKEILSLLDFIKNVFTEDELAFIKYQRHCRAHLIQKDYSPPKLTEVLKSKDKANIKKDLNRIEKFFKKKNVVDKVWEEEAKNQNTNDLFEIEENIAVSYAKKLLEAPEFKTLKDKQLELTKLLMKRWSQNLG